MGVADRVVAVTMTNQQSNAREVTRAEALAFVTAQDAAAPLVAGKAAAGGGSVASSKRARTAAASSRGS